ncbi:aminopeptidase RNPEPL1 isoform X1 [Podarcis raffonei]|uniref:aminopeptidase RNPEPL1 isoform X1 n=1 Tax=Podarcis raffonei TaxID=65483 RepID=UPI0023294CC4|nr:aminopeptidase RNPEPL1 isoform X1 [Podarcis raffonei]
MAASESPPDVASASSSSLFRLRHLRLGLHLRPDARALAGCSVLELCARRGRRTGSGSQSRRQALVLDAHPALRVASVAFRPSPAGGGRCGFVFPDAASPGSAESRGGGGGGDGAPRCPAWDPAPASSSSSSSSSSSELSGPERSDPAPGRLLTRCPSPPTGCPSPTPLSDPHPHCPLSTPSALSALGPPLAPELAGPGPPADPLAAHRCHHSCPVAGPPDFLVSPDCPLAPGSQDGTPPPDPEGALRGAAAAPHSPLAAPASPINHFSCSFSDFPLVPGVPPPPIPTFPDDPAAASVAPCPLFFRVDPFTDYGSALTISLPSSLEPHQPFQVIIRYTTIDAPAIWWLDPELTYGNAKPFVFTQGHSVCNRSFFPCFDTPAVKCTYSAIVKAPAGMQVLMSATQSTYEEEEGTYQFYMEYPIPAYLVALVAGDLVPADIGPRSKVWAEPCLLSTAISKLSGRVERWLSAAESLYGPYIWGRYDIVFLPPSFPIVAMENPCLTFIISSILESDEFLIIDVIHEVAHSWFGNAVTNATWEEMWLSEGLATYAQRRITTETYGKRQGAAFTCLETAFRLDALHRQMKLLGEDNPVSKLQVKLEPGVNPSNLMNLFTYEKGYCFVYYLSQLCGDPARFDAFLRAYIEKYKFTSVVAQDLLDSFLAFFPELKEQCIESRTGLEFERWLNATGPPLIEPDLSQGSSLTCPVETLFSLWTTEPLDAVAAAGSVDIAEWRTFQTVLFLDRLLDGSPLPEEVISKLSECYSAQLDGMNAEIRIRWLQIIVRNDYHPDLHKVRRFLENQMSRMYTIPLYEDLCTGTLKSFALDIFYQTQNQLHPNLRKTIQQILTQGLNPLLAMDAAAVMADPLAAVVEDKPPEAAHSAISLRDVNVSA